jgi:hypothetical protein
MPRAGRVANRCAVILIRGLGKDVVCQISHGSIGEMIYPGG